MSFGFWGLAKPYRGLRPCGVVMARVVWAEPLSAAVEQQSRGRFTFLIGRITAISRSRFWARQPRPLLRISVTPETEGNENPAITSRAELYSPMVSLPADRVQVNPLPRMWGRQGLGLALSSSNLRWQRHSTRDSIMCKMRPALLGIVTFLEPNAGHPGY